MNYTNSDLQAIYSNRDEYETMEFSDGSTVETGYSFIYFNGKIASCAHTADSKEGYILVATVVNINFEGIRNKKLISYLDVAKDENDKVIYQKVYGEVVIIKCNRQLVPMTKHQGNKEDVK